MLFQMIKKSLPLSKWFLILNSCLFSVYKYNININNRFFLFVKNGG